MWKVFTVVFGLLTATMLHAAPVILIYGDSLSAAYGLPARQGWGALLAQKLAPQYEVVNASISGETTAGGLARLDSTLQQHQPALVLLELGANDALRGLPLSEAEKNLGNMLKKINQSGATPLLIGMLLPPNYGPVYTRKFSDMYQRLAKQHKTALMPFLMQGFADKADYFQADGIHPNALAQPLIAEQVLKQLQPLLKKPAKPLKASAKP